MLVAVGRQHVGGFGAELEQESRQTQAEVGIAIDREFLAVDMRARIRHRVDQTAAFARQFLRDLLAGNPRQRHDEFVGRRHADRMMERRPLPGRAPAMNGSVFSVE